MEMLTKAPGKQNATSVAAHGAFARAGDEDIVVAFDYRFCGNATDELVVYLSDHPEPKTAGTAGNFIEVARIYPPADPTRPGGTSSSEFATFYGQFDRGTLNFKRGTYVELELRGPDACIIVDNWDPQVVCLACSDLNGTATVDSGDFLLMLAEIGQNLAGGEPGRFCLDSKLSGDHYVDITDLLGWDTYLNGFELNACGTGLPGGAPVLPGTPVNLPTGDSLIIAGKPGGAGIQQDYVYFEDSGGVCLGSGVTNPQRPASTPASGNVYRSNGRLIKDGAGAIYQVHANQGLIQLDNATVAIGPRAFLNYDVDSGPNCNVYVGVNDVGGGQFLGRPLLDVAFDPANPNIVYVVPVICIPLSDGNPSTVEMPYRAAAKLQRTGGGNYNLLKVYGYHPPNDPTPVTISTDEFENIVLEPDKQQVREIEVDSQGNVFVLAAQGFNRNDWLLVYDEGTGTSSERRIDLGSTALGSIRGPTAMLVSEVNPNRLYLASSVSTGGTAGDTLTQVHRYTINRSAGDVTSLTALTPITINNPTGTDQCSDPSIPDFVATIIAMPEHPVTGNLYVTGFSMPRFCENATFNGTESIFTLPTLAIVNPDGPTSVTASQINCNPSAPATSLKLPIGAIFRESSAPCPAGDTNGDRRVDNADLQAILDAWNAPLGDPRYNPDADFNHNNIVSNEDLQVILDTWADTCP
jgi:hypothetical protein